MGLVLFIYEILAESLMSSTKRLISGSIAAWMTILVSILSQVALVPVYLSHWNALDYGIWLGILSLTSLFYIVDTGHQQFIGFEFLKIGVEKIDQLSRVLSAAIPFALFIGFFQFFLVASLVKLGLFFWLFSPSNTDIGASTLQDAGTILIFSIAVFGVLGSVGGLLVRVLAPLGFYPRMAWWGVVSALGSALAPASVVILGGGILDAGLALVAWVIIYNLFLYVDMLRLLKRSGVAFQRPDMRLGMMNLWRSQILVLTALLVMARTMGTRIVLAPLAGAVSLAAFATMRTGANIALQGLTTVTNPLMPELMRVLRQRDQAKSEAAFATVWIILVAIMAPAVVILQAIVKPFFLAWTRGHIEFDPMLFGLLSLGVLVFAWTQPAVAVVNGNNLLRPQLIVATVAAIVVVGGMVILVPLMGILGAGVALLVAELFAANQFRRVAEQWLKQNGLVWPRRSAASAAMSVWIAALAISCLMFFPNMNGVILISALLLLGGNLVFYWRSLPSLAQDHATIMLGKLRFSVRTT